MPVLDLTPTLDDRLSALHRERTDIAARLAALRGADGWPDSPTGRPMTRLEREAIALADGQPIDDDDDAALLHRRLAVIDRAAQLLDAQAARRDAVVLQARVSDNVDAMSGLVSAAVKRLAPLVSGLPALREALEEARSLSADREILTDRARQGGDVASLPVVLRHDVEDAAQQVVAILERVELLVKDATASGIVK